jgi:hypothetical protein
VFSVFADGAAGRFQRGDEVLEGLADRGEFVNFLFKLLAP